MSVLLLLATFLAGSLCLVGTFIGIFYQRKFGEGTHGWLLPAAAIAAIAGLALRLFTPLPSLVGELVSFAGAALLAVGTFWLWFVMMGPRR